MDNLKSYKIRFIEQFKEYSKIGLFSSVIIALSCLILFYVIAEFVGSIYTLGFGFALFSIYLIINNFNSWVYLYIIALPGYLFFSAEGIGAEDIIYMFLYNIGLYYWFFHEVCIKKRRIVEDKKDWFFLFVFGIIALHPVVAYFNEVSFLDAYREFAISSLVLFYFPLKYLIRNEKDFKRFILILVVIIIFIDIMQLYRTYDAFKSAKQVWELSKASRMNQTIISMVILISLPLTLYTKSLKYKILGFIFVAFNMAMLISTLTRSYWVATFLSVMFMMLFFPPKKNILIVSTGILSIIIISTLSYLVLQDKAVYAYKLFEKRFSSIYETGIRKNQSLNARTVEYEAVYKRINDYPIGGSGAAKTYAYYSPIDLEKWESANIHSTYISLTYRYGFIIAFAYLLVFGIYFFDALIAIYKSKESFYRYLLIGALSTWVMFGLTNFASSLVLTREGVVVISISLALITTAKNKLEKENIKILK